MAIRRENHEAKKNIAMLGAEVILGTKNLGKMMALSLLRDLLVC